jgi:uncharacterized membrane protein YhaH (DUF805 family)
MDHDRIARILEHLRPDEAERLARCGARPGRGATGAGGVRVACLVLESRQSFEGVAMWWLAGIFVLVLSPILYLIVRNHRQLVAHPRVNEYVNLFGLSLNVTLFLLSLFSLYVAVKTYRDAEKSGKEQAATLESSRKALEAMVSTAKTEMGLMDTFVDLSRQQLDTLKSQYRVMNTNRSIKD